MAKKPTVVRTGGGLRDLLFDEIEELRSGKGNPQKAMAVANLARQIVMTAKVEIEFHRSMNEMKDGGAQVTLGTLALGRP